MHDVNPAAPASRVVARRRGSRVGGDLAALVALIALLVPIACGAPARAPTPPRRSATTGTPDLPRARVQRGAATYYGGELHGRRTASGERFDKRKMTAAHRTLPFGTRVRVTNTKNGRAVEVRINDRGPFGKRTRIIDVSEAAARRLDMIEAGVVPVTVEVLP